MRAKTLSLTADITGSATGYISLPTTRLAGVWVDVSEANVAEVQVITLASFDPADSFKLTYPGAAETVAFVSGVNATAAAIQAALRTATGDATLGVAGTTDAGPFTVTFTSTFGNAQAIAVTSPVGCTGSVATTTQGNAPTLTFADLLRTFLTTTDVAADTLYPVSELFDTVAGVANGAGVVGLGGVVIHGGVNVVLSKADNAAVINLTFFYD